MILQDIFDIKGSIDNKHYVVHKHISTNPTFKSLKTFTMSVYEIQEPVNKCIYTSTSKESGIINDDAIWEKLSKDIVKQLLDGSK